MASTYPSVGSSWGGSAYYQDPYAAAQQRAQARVDTGTTALQQALAQRLQGYQDARQRLRDDAEWALRTGADANMRRLTQQGAINSGLRDRFAERLQAQVARPYLRNTQDIGNQEAAAQSDIQSQIANLRGSLPVLQAEELGRQYGLDAQAMQQAMQQASMTGHFLPPGAQSLIQNVIQAKQQYRDLAAAGKMDQAQAVSQQAAQMRDALQRMGIDTSSIGSDVTLEQATQNAGAMGQLTPQQREWMTQMSGIDPVTGQPTLAGQQARQALEQGQINLDIMKNPEYGAAAQARMGMALQGAQLANAQRSLAAAPKASSREDLLSKWNLSSADLGLTTNWAAFDELLTQLASESLDGSTTTDQVEQYIASQSPAMRAMGIDPRAVRAAAYKFAAQSNGNYGMPDQAWQTYKQGENLWNSSPEGQNPAAVMPIQVPDTSAEPVVDPMTGWQYPRPLKWVMPSQAGGGGR